MVTALVAVLGPAPAAAAQPVDCAVVKCVALTFDDGPGPYTDRLLEILREHRARATFFLIGDKVAADPAAAARIAAAGMEIGNHTWSHPDMTMLGPQEIVAQFAGTSDAIEATTGQRPTLARTGGGTINDAVLDEAGRQGLAVINWDVVPSDWINDEDVAATRAVLMRQIKPNSVVLLHDTFATTVDVVAQFLPVLAANGYHMVTVTEMLGSRPPGSLYGGRDNGPPADELVDAPG